MRRAVLVFAIAAFACLDNQQDLEAVGQTTAFVALDRDFQGFESWQSFDLGDTVIDGLPVGTRRLYVSSLPPTGASEFPIGTKLVKVFEDPDLDSLDWDIYAMVKRGGGFNAKGSVNWEWFELSRDDNGAVTTDWRGTEPPAGRSYRCVLSTTQSPDCNACHAASKSNDYVNAQPLQLK